MSRGRPRTAIGTYGSTAEVVDAVLHSYERLSDEVRTKLSLKRVWMLTDAGF